MWFQASAPGSLMLMGEYAVVSGYPCLVMAVDQRIKVRLMPRHDNAIRIFSSLAHHHTNSQALTDHPKLRFVMAALKAHQAHIPSGCDIHVTADFSAHLGLGSSAAITASLCHALAQWCHLNADIRSLWERGMSIIHAVQGKGSGADLAASLHGGLIAFSNNPFDIRSFDAHPSISAYYSGNKQSTVDALSKQTPSPDWDERMTTLTQQALKTIRDKDWHTLATLMKSGNDLLCERGVCSERLKKLITRLKENTLKGIKISGAGFGDCVIALGKTNKAVCLNDDSDRSFRELPIRIDPQGVYAC